MALGGVAGALAGGELAGAGGVLAGAVGVGVAGALGVGVGPAVGVLDGAVVAADGLTGVTLVRLWVGIAEGLESLSGVRAGRRTVTAYGRLRVGAGVIPPGSVLVMPARSFGPGEWLLLKALPPFANVTIRPRMISASTPAATAPLSSLCLIM